MFIRQQNRIAHLESARYMSEQLYCILYRTLHRLSKEYNELTPSEVWREACHFAAELKEMPRPDMMMDELKEMLLERYSEFKTIDYVIQRTAEEAERTTFIVMSTMLYILATENKNQPDNNYSQHCSMLAMATYEHELRERFQAEVRLTEDEEEKKGRFVEMVNLELDDIDNGDGEGHTQLMDNLVDCACEYSKETIEKTIVVVGEMNARYNGKFACQEQRLRDALKQKQIVQQLNVAGDYVVEKNVENEVKHVETGATGIIIEREDRK